MSNWYELSGNPVEEENVNPITNYNEITTSTQTGDWWCSEHDARTNYNLLNDPDLVSGNWWDLGVTPLDNSGGAPSLPTLFEWSPKTAEALPGTATFTRAFVAQVLPTTDGTTFWYQEAKSGEVPLDGLRRVENTLTRPSAYDDFEDTIWAAIGGSTKSGDGTINITGDNQGVQFAGFTGIDPSAEQGIGSWAVLELSGSGTLDFHWGDDLFDGGVDSSEVEITLTSTPTKYAVFHKFDGGSARLSTGVRLVRRSGQTATSITLHSWGSYREQNTQSGLPPPILDPSVEYLNIGVNGVRYFATTNGNSVDGSGVVTEATGTTITGGGYLPEPAATNRLLHSNDMTQAAWVAQGAVTPTDLGVTDIGGKSTQIAGLGALGVDDISQSVGGFTASGSIAPSFLLQRVSATGTLRIVNAAGGAANGEWTVDLSQIGTGWVRLEPGANVVGFTEVTTWVADGSGNGGIAYAASAGGPLTVNLAFNNGENTAFSPSPIVTSGSTVTRVADVLDSGATIASEFGALLDVTLPNVIGPGNTISLLAPDATAEDILRVDASFNIIMDDGGTPVTIGTASAGARIKVSYGRDASGRSASLDGTTVVTGGAPGSGHEGDTFQVGAANSVNQSRAIQHLTTIYSVRPSDSSLEALSA